VTQPRTMAARAGISAEDIAEWEALRAARGPFVSAYIDTVVHDVSTPKELARTWRDASAVLWADGAPDAALAAISARLEDAHLRTDAVAVVSDATGALLERDVDAPIGATRTAWSPVPMLTPFLEWLQSREPHVVVVVDHAGADLAVFDRHSGTHVESLGEEDTSDPDLHHGKPGGWSQSRFQRRTKGRWRANAGEAAARLTRIVEELRPRVIGVGGDVRSVPMFLEQLPPTVREQVREVAGTRARDGSEHRHEDEVARLIRTVVAEDTVMLAHKFTEELGQGDLAVVGADATLAALAEARVETLLVHDDPGDERTAWFAHDLGQVAASAADLRALGSREHAEARLVDVAVRAALGTGASVRVIPRLAVLREGIGATLRHH
jgi:hypothetical protein